MFSIIDGLSNHDYHHDERYAGLSKSGISEFLKSPAHFKYGVREETTAMTFGSAVHTAILEPELFKPAVFDGAVRRGKTWDSFFEQNQDKTIVTASELEVIEGMRKSIEAHETASNLIKMDGPVEQSIFWDDATYSFQCKCRPDKRIPDLGIIVDLKTCADASPVGFSKASAKYGYDIHSAFYLVGVNSVQDIHHKDFIFIAVEKEPPYLVGVYRASDAFINYGREKIRAILPMYAECLKTDVWPGYPDKIIDLDLPSWAA